MVIKDVMGLRREPLRKRPGGNDSEDEDGVKDRR